MKKRNAIRQRLKLRIFMRASHEKTPETLNQDSCKLVKKRDSNIGRSQKRNNERDLRKKTKQNNNS